MPNSIWLLILYFAVSGIAGLLARQAKKKQQRQQSAAGRSSRPRDAMSPTPPAFPSSPTSPAPSTQRQSPADIAAEIRRMMGLEPAGPEPRVEVIEEHIEPADAPDYGFDPEPQHEPDHRGRLRDRILEQEAHPHQPGTPSLGNLTTRFDSPDRATVPRRSRAVSRRGYVDITNLARALVTIEILGKPKALRDDGF